MRCLPFGPPAHRPNVTSAFLTVIQISYPGDKFKCIIRIEIIAGLYKDEEGGDVQPARLLYTLQVGRGVLLPYYLIT